MFETPPSRLDYLKTRFLNWCKSFAAAPNAAKAWQQTGRPEKHLFWLFATPVHLLLGRDHFVMYDPSVLHVGDDELNALLTSLNDHFSHPDFYLHGFAFYQADGQCFLGMDTDPQITTTPIDIVINQNISAYLPMGQGALDWAKWQNELQMLLFSHPVNLAREARGELPINSFWCYGLAESNKP